MKYEFNSKKYITKGIAETLLPELQLFLFSCIDTMRIKTDGQLDYLQVFRLETVTENNISLLHICHEQEQPRHPDVLSYMSDNLLSSCLCGIYDQPSFPSSCLYEVSTLQHAADQEL